MPKYILTEDELPAYLMSKGWKRKSTPDGSLGWEHPEVNRLIGTRIYSTWAAAAFQSGVDDFIEFNLKR